MTNFEWLESQPNYDAILKEKQDYYGKTECSYMFAATAYAEQYHAWKKLDPALPAWENPIPHLRRLDSAQTYPLVNPLNANDGMFINLLKRRFLHSTLEQIAKFEELYEVQDEISECKNYITFRVRLRMLTKDYGTNKPTDRE